MSGGLGVTIASLAAADAFAMPVTTVKKDAKKLGVALVGLGSYAKNQLAVALEKTTNCYLAGIVTGTPSKADEWQKKALEARKRVVQKQREEAAAKNPLEAM